VSGPEVFRRRVTYALAPFLRFAPAWHRWRLYSRLRGDPYGEDGFAGVSRRVALKPHGYVVDLELGDWMERFSALTRHYYDPATIFTLTRLLRPGDVFIDVGANIGMISLTAARLVGDSGRVLAFEPNARLAQRLEATIAANGLGRMRVFPVALGNEVTTARLETGAQHGAGSLRSGAGAPVPVRRGDDFVADIPENARIFLKIDVEGYEQRVLAGFEKLLARPSVVLFVEVTDAWLRELGGSAQGLFEMMSAQGYDAFTPKLDWRSRLAFEQLGGPLSAHQYDVVFVRPDDPRTPAAGSR